MDGFEHARAHDMYFRRCPCSTSSAIARKCTTVVSKLGGTITFKVVACDEEKKKVELHISDAGICAATPHIIEVNIKWKGSRKAVRELKVRKQAEREWTKEDRVVHKKRIDKAKLGKLGNDLFGGRLDLMGV